MKEYTVYFEIYGKKMKTTVFASSEDSAKQKIINRLKFLKIEVNEVKNPIETFLNPFKEI